jgi:hypothetical protein
MPVPAPRMKRARIAPSQDPVRVDVSKLTASPSEYADRIVMPENYLKIGTKTTRVLSGQQTLHVRDSRGATLANGKDLGHEPLVFLVDDGVAMQLHRMLSSKGVPAEYLANFKSILKLRVGELPGDGQTRWAATVVEMEILLGFSPLLIAQGRLDRAFQVLKVSPTGAYALVVGGDEWVARLGGDEFLTHIRKEVRDAQRKARANANRALADNNLAQMYAQTMRAALQEDINQARLRQRLFGVGAR